MTDQQDTTVVEDAPRRHSPALFLLAFVAVLGITGLILLDSLYRHSKQGPTLPNQHTQVSLSELP